MIRYELLLDFTPHGFQFRIICEVKPGQQRTQLTCILQHCVTEHSTGIGQTLLNMFHLVEQSLPNVFHCGGTCFLHPTLNILLDAGQLIAGNAHTEVIVRYWEHCEVHLELGRDVIGMRVIASIEQGTQ